MITIESIQSHVFHVSNKTNWWFVVVADSSGALGWGEGSLNGWEPVLDAYLEHMKPQWTGMALSQVCDQVRAAPASPGGLVCNTVVSAFLQAILSLQSQHAGQPMHAVLGPLLRDHVPLYANINRATSDRSPAGFVAVARQAQAQGFTRFKIAPFDGLTPALCGSSQGQAIIHRGIDCLQALRDAMGPEVLLMVDCHWRMDEARALSTLALLEPVGLHWFECPLAETHANWPALRRIRQAARQQGVLLAAAETQVGLSSFQAVFEEALYDVVMPDVKYCGGPWEMLRIAQQAHTHGVQFSPHNPSGPVCTWQSLQVALVAPECAMLEFQFAESDLYFSVNQGVDIDPHQGHLRQPGAGSSASLAVQGLDQSLLAQHPYQRVPPGIETQLNR